MSKTNKKVKRKVRRSNTRALVSQQIDSVFFLKLVLFLILGSLWVRIQTPSMQIPLPIGLAFGLLFASHEHFQIDRKIEYAFLLIAMFVGFWLPLGIVIGV